MKNLLLLSIFMLFTFASFAQNAPAENAAKPAKMKQVQNPAAYACPKCYMISKGAGQCDMCHIDKVQLGTYFCEHCQKGSGAKAGKCESCGAATTQMTRKLCGKHNHDMPMKKAA